MNRKSLYVCGAIVLIGALASIPFVRGMVFELYDRLAYSSSFNIEGERFHVSGKWIVDDSNAKTTTVREAGLVDNYKSLVSVFSLKKISSPCGKYGMTKDIDGMKVLYCEMQKDGILQFKVYEVRDLDIFIMFSDEQKASSLLRNLAKAD